MADPIFMGKGNYDDDDSNLSNRYIDNALNDKNMKVTEFTSECILDSEHRRSMEPLTTIKQHIVNKRKNTTVATPLSKRRYMK